MPRSATQPISRLDDIKRSADASPTHRHDFPLSFGREHGERAHKAQGKIYNRNMCLKVHGLNFFRGESGPGRRDMQEEATNSISGASMTR
jgi:hypothetical protein